MTDDATPPRGITRPDIAALQTDPLGEACRDEIATIRGQVAAAKDRVAVWEPAEPTPRRTTTARGRLPSLPGGQRS